MYPDYSESLPPPKPLDVERMLAFHDFFCDLVNYYQIVDHAVAHDLQLVDFKAWKVSFRKEHLEQLRNMFFEDDKDTVRQIYDILCDVAHKPERMSSWEINRDIFMISEGVDFLAPQSLIYTIALFDFLQQKKSTQNS